jgi:hypothetical protein
MDENYGNHTFFDNCHTTRLQTHGRSQHASSAGTGPERMGRSLHDQAALELCVDRMHLNHSRPAGLLGINVGLRVALSTSPTSE